MTWVLLLLAGDWLNQGLRSQQHERDLNTSNAAKIRQLWKRQLTDGPLSAPIILGRLITYRGTVELVFVQSGSGQLFAIDGDFGKTFWTRDLSGGVTKCPSPATPALTPDAPDHDEDDDGPQPLRPIYALAPNGDLHSLHPIDGKDVSPPRPSPCAAYLVANKTVSTKKNAPKHSPILANGLRLELTNALRVYDAKTNAKLYESEPIKGASTAAVANGHICFTAAGALMCYGVPLDN